MKRTTDSARAWLSSQLSAKSAPGDKARLSVWPSTRRIQSISDGNAVGHFAQNAHDIGNLRAPGVDRFRRPQFEQHFRRKHEAVADNLYFVAPFQDIAQAPEKFRLEPFQPRAFRGFQVGAGFLLCRKFRQAPGSAPPKRLDLECRSPRRGRARRPAGPAGHRPARARSETCWFSASRRRASSALAAFCARDGLARGPESAVRSCHGR